MRVRRIAFAPLYVLADWTDDNPISALGAAVAFGAVAALLASITVVGGVDPATLAFDSATAELLTATAIERPAYLAAGMIGLAAVVFYKG